MVSFQQRILCIWVQKHLYIMMLCLTIIKLILNILLPFTAYIPLGYLFFIILKQDKLHYLKQTFQVNISIVIFCVITLICSCMYLFHSILLPSKAIISIFFVFLIQAFDEEIIYRQFPVSTQDFMKQNARRIILRSSALFSVLHFTSVITINLDNIVFILGYLFLVRFITAILLNLIYIKNTSILEVTFFHLLYNSLGFQSEKNSILMIIIMFMYTCCLYRDKIRAIFKEMNEM